MTDPNVSNVSNRPNTQFPSNNNNDDDDTTNTITGYQPELQIVILVPIVIFAIFASILVLIIYKLDRASTNKLKLVIYILIQFIMLPFLVVFVAGNAISMAISYLACKKLVYLSSKDIINFIINCKNRFRTGENSVIQIAKKQEEGVKMPERAERYREVANDSKTAQMGPSPNLQLSNNVSGNNIGNSNQQLNMIADKNNNVNLNIQKPPQRPSGKKNKVMDFLSKALVGDDNTPSYVNLIRTIKNNTKAKMQNKTENVIVINK